MTSHRSTRRAATRAAGALLLSLAAAAGPAGAQQPPAPPAGGGAGEQGRAVRQRTLYDDLQLFSGVLNQIRVNHADSIDPHVLVMAAIRGMVQAADPYSGVVAGTRLSPEKEKLLREGKLYPVGIDFEFRGDWTGAAPVVRSVTPGSSASKEDILPGDELIAIDSQPVLAENVNELDITLRGPKRSKVKLTFARTRADGSRASLTREVKREALDEGTGVPVATMLDPQTGYVRVTTFDNTNVAEDLHKAVGQLEDRGMKRLILDIRGNGGGYVREASQIAGEFLPKGAIVYTVDARKAEVRKDTGRVDRSFFSREKRYPMIVMVDEGSASASELVAGALQDHDRALLVGRPSHGKALEMTTMPIMDGASTWSYIYLNIGRVKTPCGRIIQRPFRGMTRREYFRRAGAVVDTAGRPSCRTTSGRTVYGGGGVYPDVFLPDQTTPLWLVRANEASLPLRWVGLHLQAKGASYTSLDALVANPTLAPADLAEFRKLASGEGITIPAGAAEDALLQRTLLGWIADAKWGGEGRYRVDAVLDPEVKMGLAAFDRAAAILVSAK